MPAKKPRILISSFTFPPESNGVANAAYSHAKIMQDLGCEVDVITYGDAVLQDNVHGLMVSRFPVFGKGHLLSPYRGSIKELHNYLNGNSWDIVFMHCWQAWNTNCLVDFFSALARTEKLILVSHGISTNSNTHRFPLNWIRRCLWLPYRVFSVPRYLRLIDNLVVLWDFLDKDRFLDHTLARSTGTPVSVIPNLARFNPLAIRRPVLRFSDEELAGGFILSVGNYSEDKNELFVLEAYMKSRLTNIPLIFVGHRHNRYSAKLEKYAQKWGLSKVQFCEQLAKDEIDWLYKSALLFLCGSKTECQPMVIIDSLASETACISTDVGCVSSFGCVLVVSDVEELAAGIRTLLLDTAQREKLIRQGIELYNTNLCHSSVRNKWEHLLIKLLPHQESKL